MRPLPLAAGAAAVLGVWGLPVETWLGGFPGHMVVHMTLVAVAAPLLVLGAPGVWRRMAIPALAGAVIEFAVVWGWHLPALHGFARTLAVPYALEQAMFLAAGLAVWAGALAAPQPLAGAGALLLTSMHMTLLGALMILARSDLYAAFCGTPPDLAAQQMGGMLMLAIGTPVYLIAGLWLTGRALQERSP
ncbi:cytochrome-c oxidase [Mesobaculum littorinae]|uniref:Cytochrome-c oxidase n=1 Tax=Mesobaculum littorinae TaxID=2486419 RepID=A0A438ADP9_9RHOB|nr:cytochrome c oxidase assembly protein [Mesobaculum littorinae]RVV96830.1 cytochrome-c oxidase [Mesobaculum littorinae]